MKLCRPASRAACSMSAGVAPSRPRPMFAAMLLLKSTRSCGTTAIIARSLETGRVSIGMSLMAMLPVSGSQSRSRSLTREDLPQPLAPTMAMDRPAGTSRFRAVNTGGPPSNAN